MCCHYITRVPFEKTHQPPMEACPFCQRIFTSSRYLISHLHQSACRHALLPTNHDQVTTNGSTLAVSTRNSSIRTDKDAPPKDNVAYHPMAVNAFGDVIVAVDDENSGEFPTNFSDTEESTGDQFVAVCDVTGNSLNKAINSSDGSPTLEHLLNPISTIDQNESFNVPVGCDDKLIPMLRMIAAVRAAGAPIVLLDNLVKIIKHEWQLGRLDITHLCTHKTALRRISKFFPLIPTPEAITVTHERTANEMSSGIERPSLTFPRFSFIGQLQDLLDDHVFSDLQNLVVDPDNRWDHYRPNSCPHSTDEIQDGLWFQGIVEQVKKDTSPEHINDFIFGIQGYADKTGTDAYQRTSAEPLVITLTLFTNGIRNQDKYWRVLALLPTSLCQDQRKKHSYGASVRNYHLALKLALAELTEVQRNPPIVRLRLGDQYRYVRARIFWVNTIADGLANESLTGRIQNRNSSPRLSRGCHCPQIFADDSTRVCKYIRQAAVEQLTVAALGPPVEVPNQWNDYLESLESNKERRAAESSLKIRKKLAQAILNNVFGQHVVDLVWFHVDQGPNPRGCFGSTPVDPMHAVEEGIIPNIMSVILDPLSESAKARLDDLAIKIVACNRWDSEYPRMNFSGGFSSLTQLTADEKVGKMILLLIIMHTTTGKEIMDNRCNSTFDEQRVTRAARFTSNMVMCGDDDEESQGSETSKELPNNLGNRHYTGTAAQLQSVDHCLFDHGLQFVVPWIDEMIPCHQEILRRIVFQVDCNRGKGLKYKLPQASFLDRHEVIVDSSPLYCEGQSDRALPELTTEEARYSIDCTLDELKNLLEMILSFHAAYKYGNRDDKGNFDSNVRLMMSLIKRRIHRGRDTKNWSISKFHDLLHMGVDSMNFGSHANLDAGKGEHGLKKWAKLPSKTVRTRHANLYYQDMATRIYENRLIELATATLVPRTQLTPDTNTGDENPDQTVTFELSNLLMRLDVIGPSLLQPELTAYLRGRPNLVFPMDIYQEARYSTNGNRKGTIRGTPKYRNSGPWHDCVLVSYEDDLGEKKEYPFQVHGFFYQGRERTYSAVGKMGMNKKENSRLLDEWTYEKNYRIVDLETTSRAVFALTIPLSCYRDTNEDTPHRMYVFRDRIGEWPSIFNEENWDNKYNNRRKRKKGNK